MWELPLHPAGRHGPSLAVQRDRLLKARDGDPEGFRNAMATLVAECISETLGLTGAPVSKLEVARVKSEALPAGDRIDLIRGQVEALGAIERAAQTGRTLTVGLISEVHRLSNPPSTGAFRRGPARAQFAAMRPSHPDLVPAQVDNLIEWLAADSGSSLRLPEKSALAFARLLEISPFESGNFRTAHLLLSFFAFAEGYPPLFLRAEEAAEVREDIECALRFDTLPLVNRLARAQSRSLTDCLEMMYRGRHESRLDEAPREWRNRAG